MATKGELLASLGAGLADERAQHLRERIGREIPARLAENAQRLSIHWFLTDDPAGMGFATATAMAAELGAGAAQLFTGGNAYAGTALVRQLIECNYLLSLMAENRSEAESWMNASHTDIVQTFMPRHMRTRSVQNFRQSEYETHCDRGGHPNPAARDLVRRLTTDAHPQLPPNGRWLDLAEHLVDVWASFVAGLHLYDPRQDRASDLHSPERSPDGRHVVADLIAEWRQDDIIARPDPRDSA